MSFSDLQSSRAPAVGRIGEQAGASRWRLDADADMIHATRKERIQEGNRPWIQVHVRTHPDPKPSAYRGSAGMIGVLNAPSQPSWQPLKNVAFVLEWGSGEGSWGSTMVQSMPP